MRYYPMFLSLSEKTAVVVGGGKVGLRKTKGLLGAGARVKVISPAWRAEFEGLPVKLVRRAFRASDLKGACLAFAATDHREVNRRVEREAKRLGIPVNVADDPAACDFIVPARVRSGELQVAVSTSGRSPRLAAELKRKIGAVLKGVPLSAIPTR
ncbi:MAG: bifunctional precorrin-2 dehydrogenase/sirohydrochlorin ferrochelatase [Acidobacteria bacterium]|nr:bifunctional precorrin-2 dehydrogenase/sirohydrochlorin ferrochelatase [Acidobacteriota bacterium]